MQIDSVGSSTAYNRLHGIFQSNEEFITLDQDAVLNELANVVLKHQLEDKFGIRLLHKHNEIAEDELMLEQTERGQRGATLTTIARFRASVLGECYPNSWKLEGKTFVPLEFSLDPRVGQVGEAAKVGAFFQEFGECLRSLGVSKLLGPCVVDREFFDSEKTSPEAILVETTDEERRANVLMFAEPSEYPPSRLVPATWTVERPTGSPNSMTGCKTTCAKGVCVRTTACVVDPVTSSHSHESHHDSQHVTQHYEGSS